MSVVLGMVSAAGIIIDMTLGVKKGGPSPYIVQTRGGVSKQKQ